MGIVAKNYISPYTNKKEYERQKELATVSRLNYDPIKAEQLKEQLKAQSKKANNSWFNTSAFDDGYQFGDITKTIFSTGGDIGLDLLQGGLNTIEGITDTGTYLLADIVDFFGADNVAKSMRENADFNSFGAWFGENEEGQNLLPKGWQEGIEENSILGGKSDQVVQSIGQIGGYALTGGVLGGGVTANNVVIFSSAYGNAKSEAKRNGASENDAIKKALVSATAETISENLFDAMPFVKSSGFGDKVIGKFFNKKVGKVTGAILNSFEEGSEEIISNLLDVAGTYAIDYIDKATGGKGWEYGMQNLSGDIKKDLKDTFMSEETWEAFFSAALSTALVGAGHTAISNTRMNNAINSYAKENNVSVEQAKKDFETVLGGVVEEYKTDDMSVKKQYELENQLKGQLSKSVKQGLNLSEVAKSVRTDQENQNYKFEFTQGELKTYKDNKVAQNIMEKVQNSDINNTKKAHEIVKTAIKVAEELNVNVDFTNNSEITQQLIKNRQQELGRELTDKEKAELEKYASQINGMKLGNNILLNTDSKQSAKYTLGHELKHFLEQNSKLNEELNEKLIEWAKTKGVYDTDFANMSTLYSQVKNANVIDELTANYTGEFFSSEANLKAFATENPGLFTKIANYFKKLYYKATNQQEKLLIQEINEKIQKVYSEVSKERKNLSVDRSSKVDIEEDTLFSKSFNDILLRNKNLNSKSKIDIVKSNEKIDISKANSQRLQEDFKNNVKNGEYKNKATDYTANINSETKSKITNPSQNINKTQKEYIIRMIAAQDLPTLFENAVYIDTLPPMKGKNNNTSELGYHHFVAPIEIDGDLYRVLISGKEKENSKKLYSLDIEVLPQKNGNNPRVNQYSLKGLSPSEISISDLVKNVKLYNYDTKQQQVYNAKDIKYSLSPSGEMVDNNGDKVTFEVTQVKSPLPVSDDKTLIAIHNLSEDKFKGVIELGGFPVPSIAITNPDKVSHNEFGDGTLIFNKSTIDPAIKKNEVYDRDVWSPTFPRVEYEANEKTLDDIRKSLKLDYRNEHDSIQRKAVLDLYTDRIENLLDSGDLERVRDEIKNNRDIQYSYLKEKGLIEPIYKQHEFNDDVSNEVLQEFLDKYKGSTDFSWNTPLNDLSYEQTMELSDVIKKIVKPYFEKTESKYGNDLVEKSVNAYNNFNQLNKFIRSADNMSRRGINYQEIDEYATLDKARDILNKEEYDKWVDETFNENLINDKGIRNDKDIFTPSGNRRSFKATHNPINLETLVKALSRGETKGGQEMSIFGTGFGRISAQTANKFNSIKDIKANENRLMSREEAGKIIEPLSVKLYADTEALSKYYNPREYKSDIVANMQAMDNTSQVIEEFAGKSLTSDNLKKILSEWGYNTYNIDAIPQEVIDNIIDDLKQAKQLPTDYFEAKPQRAVGLDEIQMAVIPNNWSTETKQRLTDSGIKYTEYDPNIEGDRQRVINQFQELKFQLGEQNTTLQDVDKTSLSELKVKEKVKEKPNLPTAQKNLQTKVVQPKKEKQEVNLPTEQKVKRQVSEAEKRVKDKVKKAIENQSYKAVNIATKTGQKYLDFDRKQKTEFKEALSKYIGKTQQQLTNAKTWNDIKELVSNYANKEITYVDEELKSIKNEIRKQNIKVTEDLKNQITDYGDFRRSVFGKLKLGDTGTSVDSLYQELSEQYPYYFGEATTQQDMLYEIADFMNQDVNTVQKFRLDDETIDEAVTKTYNALMRNAMTKDSVEELTAKLEAKMNERTRAVIQEELLNDMGVTLQDISKGKDIKAIDMFRTDPIRLNEKVFGNETGNKINDATIRRTKHNEAERTRWLNQERNEIKDLGIKARSKESAAVQKYGEKQYVNEHGEVMNYGDAELAKEFSDIETQEKIKKAAQVLRNKYDMYIDQINNSLVNMGYKPIQKRNDYMRHFQALNDVFSRFGTPLNKEGMQNDALPTDINGLTDQFKPGKQYFASALQRLGMKTEYDAITGIDGYLEGASNLIYHTEDIQRYRTLAKLIRNTYGTTHGYEDFATMTPEQQTQRIEDIQSNKLSKYAAWLDEQANALAGKKGGIDRAAERMLGRKVYNVLDTAKKQVGSNMTGYNVRSAMTNFASAVQGASKTNKLAFIKGTISTINNIIHDDGLIDKSDFLTSRLSNSKSLSQKAWQKASAAGQIFMSGTDWFTANQIWRSKYYENLQNGMSENEAIKQADDFASRIMGDRSKGATAEAFNSKTLGFFTQFQLEVNNQWSSLIHDNKMDIQNGTKSVASMIFQTGQLFGLAYLFNGMMKALTGSKVMLDPIELFKKIFAPDDDDKTMDERAREALGDVIDDLPFVSFMTGGRIPVKEAFKGAGTFIDYATGKKNDYGQDITLEDVKNDVIESAAYWLLPTGYGQIRKTTKGLGMYDENLPIAGSYTKSGRLRFEAEDTTAARVQAALFGEYSSQNAREYLDKGYQPLTENQIQEAVDSGLKVKDYRKYSEGLKEQETTEDKVDYIANLPYSMEQKNVLVNNVLKRNEDIDLTNYNNYGSLAEFDYANKNPEKYAAIKQITSYDKYLEYQNGINNIKSQYSDTNTRKAAIRKYINSLKLNKYQKVMLEKLAGGYSIKSYESEMFNYINGLNMTKKEKETLHKQLFG